MSDGPWTRFIAGVPDLSVLSDETLDKAQAALEAEAYGVPRKLKCPGCQLGDHCNGEDDNCYCECTEKADPFS